MCWNHLRQQAHVKHHYWQELRLWQWLRDQRVVVTAREPAVSKAKEGWSDQECNRKHAGEFFSIRGVFYHDFVLQCQIVNAECPVTLWGIWGRTFSPGFCHCEGDRVERDRWEWCKTAQRDYTLKGIAARFKSGTTMLGHTLYYKNAGETHQPFKMITVSQTLKSLEILLMSQNAYFLNHVI